jgi:hypothetical protein
MDLNPYVFAIDMSRSNLCFKLCLLERRNDIRFRNHGEINLIALYKNWDGAESKTRPSNLPDINLNQSELTRDTYLVRVNPHKSSSNSRK